MLFFFSKYSIRVSNGSDPDQDRRSVGPDLGSNCLQRLSAGDFFVAATSSKERANSNKRCVRYGCAFQSAGQIATLMGHYPRSPLLKVMDYGQIELNI